ncbi:MAG: hypothetical protein ACLR4Z_04925 [Butyricicoccaceae bacterium]
MTWNSWHMSGIERKACMEGFGFYSALRYSEMPRWYRENVRHVNVSHDSGRADGRAWLVQLRSAGFAPEGRLRCYPMLSSLRSTSICRAASVGFEDAIHISQVDMIVESDDRNAADGRQALRADRRLIRRLQS